MDMVPRDENLRDTADEIERMRDISHVKNLSLCEIKNLYEENKIVLDFQEKNKRFRVFGGVDEPYGDE